MLLAGGFELLFPELEGLLLCEVLPEEPQAASPSTRTTASIIAKVLFIVLFPFTLEVVSNRHSFFVYKTYILSEVQNKISIDRIDLPFLV